MARNARFLVWVNGDQAKITLRPGQSLTHYQHYKTDEGWGSETVTWSYPDDAPVISRDWFTDGTDCDGRLCRGGEDECSIDDLGCHNDGEYPSWRESGSYQHDQYAELADY